MTEYRELGVNDLARRPINEWRSDGWELVGLHQKRTRSYDKPRTVAILRRLAGPRDRGTVVTIAG